MKPVVSLHVALRLSLHYIDDGALEEVANICDAENRRSWRSTTG